MKRAVRWIILALVAVGIIAALVLAFRPQPVPVEFAEVTRGPLQVGVEEDGQTRIRERYVISAPLAGRLQRITLDPGDPITAGQTLLAAIDPTDPSLLDVRELALAEARVGAAEAALRQTDARYERAQAELDFAEKDLARIRELAPGTFGEEELDRAELRRETALQDLRSAQFAQDVSRFELEQAQAAMVRTQPEGSATQPTTDSTAQLRLIAPVEGVVLRLLQESSAVVTAGTPLLEVGDPRDLEAVVDVLSTDAVQIEPGAPATIERWGGGEPLRAAVRLVEPAAFTKFSALGVEEQRVNVILDLVSPYEERRNLGDAYRIEANITLWQADDVVQVPTGALFRRGDQWSVFVVENGIAAERPVRIGHRNGLAAEVLEGLEPGEKVIAYPSDRVSAGTKVVAR